VHDQVVCSLALTVMSDLVGKGFLTQADPNAPQLVTETISLFATGAKTKEIVYGPTAAPTFAPTAHAEAQQSAVVNSVASLQKGMIGGLLS